MVVSLSRKYNYDAYLISSWEDNISDDNNYGKEDSSPTQTTFSWLKLEFLLCFLANEWE